MHTVQHQVSRFFIPTPGDWGEVEGKEGSALAVLLRASRGCCSRAWPRPGVAQGSCSAAFCFLFSVVFSSFCFSINPVDLFNRGFADNWSFACCVHVLAVLRRRYCLPVFTWFSRRRSFFSLRLTVSILALLPLFSVGKGSSSPLWFSSLFFFFF